MLCVFVIIVAAAVCFRCDSSAVVVNCVSACFVIVFVVVVVVIVVVRVVVIVVVVALMLVLVLVVVVDQVGDYPRNDDGGERLSRV